MATEYEAAFAAGQRAAATTLRPYRADEEAEPYLVIPPGYQLTPVPYQRPRPVRIEAQVELADVASFVSYVERYRTDATVLFASPAAGEVKAVLDYHLPDAPSHCAHVARLVLQRSGEYVAWLELARPEGVTQGSLAAHLDEHLADIRAPEAPQVLKAVGEFNLRRNAIFKAATDVHSDRMQLLYEERDEAKGGGSVVVPKQFLLGLPVYLGGKAWELTVRLGYRLVDGKDGAKSLRFQLTILRQEQLLREAFKAELQAAEARLGLTAFLTP